MTFDLKHEGGLKFTKVNGIEKLVNYVEKMFLTSYNGEFGCYLKTFIGKNNVLMDDVVREITRIKRQIKERQEEADFFIPAKELLADIKIKEIKKVEGKIEGTVLIINREGEELERKLFSK